MSGIKQEVIRKSSRAQDWAYEGGGTRLISTTMVTAQRGTCTWTRAGRAQMTFARSKGRRGRLLPTGPEENEGQVTGLEIKGTTRAGS